MLANPETNIDVTTLKIETIKDMEWLDSFKGNCTCSLFSTPETVYCLEGHTPRLQLHAKWNLWRNYPHTFDLMFYGDVSN